MGGLRELFLNIEHFLVRSPELVESLEALDSNIGALAIQAAYSPEENRALFVLVFDTRRTPRVNLDRLGETFQSLLIDCFELSALTASEREHFQRVELPRYTLRVDAAETLSTAVSALARLASQDRLEPTDEEPWARGTPVEVKRPRELASAASGAAEQLFPRIESDEPERPGSYSQVRRRGESSAPRARAAAGTGGALAAPEPAVVTPDPGPLPPPDPSSERRLRVRFLRGERWLPGRVRYVSNREAKIATAAPLRLGDAAIIGLSFERDEIFLPGTVSSVVGLEDSTSRSPGFTVAFAKLPGEKKTRLIELLRRARDAGVAIRPPPIRRAPRFPVSWPLVINSGGPARRAVALDISWSGLYIDARGRIGDELLFALPLDVPGTAVRGRGHIVRVVDAPSATLFQTVPGIGIAISHLGSGDARRYREFLDRVKARSQRRVVVAARPSRAPTLARALSAAGYAVTSSTDPSALLELAGREPRPPDVFIIDEGLEGGGDHTHLLEAFRSRNVPCLSARGDERSERARQEVDALLELAEGP